MVSPLSRAQDIYQAVQGLMATCLDPSLTPNKTVWACHTVLPKVRGHPSSLFQLLFYRSKTIGTFKDGHYYLHTLLPTPNVHQKAKGSGDNQNNNNWKMETIATHYG
jgi:hypothetical protein